MFNTISSQASKLINLTKKEHSRVNSKTKIIAITSGKGGVGKSTITANMAYLFSQYGKNVAVVDADIGLANMQILFNLKPKKTLYDHLENGAKLEEIISQTQYDNISLVAGKSGHNFIHNNSSRLYSRIILDIVALNKYDILLIDTGAGLNDYVQEFLEIADEIVAITTTDPSALTDVYALLKMISTTKKRLFLAFNQTANYKIGQAITQSLKDLALKNRLNRNFMVKYIGNVIPDLNIATTGRLRKLFVKEFAGSSSALDLERIVDSLIKEIK
ncbi:MAG: AAA family ATPase [Arcobacteraceae bacterium]|nr:AAA family ATPase [Arcobacteraceae bacterium]